MRISLFIFAVLLAAPGAASAQTVKDRAGLYEDLDRLFGDAGPARITPSDLREAFKNVIASSYNSATDGTPSYFDGSYNSLSGKPIFGNAASKDVGAASGTVAAGDDSRFSDSRPPTAHTHPIAEISDATALAQDLVKAATQAAARAVIGAGTSNFDGAYSSLSGKPTLGDAAAKNTGTSSGTVAAGDDSRLSDPRTPTSHTHSIAEISDATALAQDLVKAATQAAARAVIGAGTSNFDGAYNSLSGKPTLGNAAAKNTGTSSGTVAAGDDSRFSDSRTPTSHTHPIAEISDATALAQDLVKAATQVAARAVIGAGTSNFDGAYNSLSGKPTLGDAASKNTGTSTGTVAAGDDSRITNAVPNTRTVAGKVLSSNVTLDAGDVGASAAVQVFTSSASWTKPTGAKVVTVYVVGGGGGGGSGRRGAAGTNRFGAGGGGGGAFSRATFSAALLASSETVTVGSGGSGGAARSSDSTNGAAGGDGGSSSFGAWLRAGGGTGGAGGSDDGASGGSAGQGEQNGGDGYAGPFSGGGSGGPSEAYSAGGGASGAGLTTDNASYDGADGGPAGRRARGSMLFGGSAGTAGGSGSAGDSVATNLPMGGAGGGSGASSSTTNAGAGGNGGLYGGGGGGGACSQNAAGNSGAGGNGAAGIVVVITQF